MSDSNQSNDASNSVPIKYETVNGDRIITTAENNGTFVRLSGDGAASIVVQTSDGPAVVTAQRDNSVTGTVAGNHKASIAGQTEAQSIRQAVSDALADSKFSVDEANTLSNLAKSMLHIESGSNAPVQSNLGAQALASKGASL